MRAALALAGLAVVAVSFAGVALAHGNHATASPQVSANGTVVVEEAFLSTNGYLVLYADDGGDPGRVVGVLELDRGRHVGVRVRLDPRFWATVSGNATLRATLHEDAELGDDFDPSTDRRLQFFGRPIRQRVPVARGDRPASVVTRGAGSLENDSVSVVSATLPERGHLVAHATGNGTLGRPLGSRSLAAGRHTDVRVPVNTTGLDERAVLAVAVHTDDGNGRFEPAADPVVEAGDDPVASRYERVPGGHDPIRVNTPSPAPGGEGTADRTRGTDAPTETVADGAGPGVPVAVAAVALVAVWLVHRRGV
ncbi:hypothetical protein BV210_10210 [Halorientalis sp. IM1011]|uniref:DUF7282 domain-containing protein n=1 Tax=Halorientalis sp. IM1011 TaxID=1932360 RepID=UPI00097CD43E|nr:hypothetical protein [Halorientalis sp. IM1011]AQL43063.1 hypothetical protein BV210_10210 [Halorientalis sp. IM1011]